jgi:hypothetical protein
MNANTAKNTEYAQKQAAKVRPVSPNYNFANLEAVVRSWVNPVEEIYSPYLGAL